MPISHRDKYVRYGYMWYKIILNLFRGFDFTCNDVTTSETEKKLFQPLKSSTIILVTMNMLENIHQLQ